MQHADDFFVWCRALEAEAASPTNSAGPSADTFGRASSLASRYAKPFGASQVGIFPLFSSGPHLFPPPPPFSPKLPPSSLRLHCCLSLLDLSPWPLYISSVTTQNRSAVKPSTDYAAYHMSGCKWPSKLLNQQAITSQLHNSKQRCYQIFDQQCSAQLSCGKGPEQVL